MELAKEKISTRPPPLKNLLRHGRRIPDESKATKTRLRTGLEDSDYQAIGFNHNQWAKVYLAGTLAHDRGVALSNEGPRS